ncbi:MAG TPA: branched-chain amino acid ABC transporter substrate-binding protein [Actinomycetota bacterium]|nr:branched-chain amino acid ABC transporter substrate-binding protein [Actinomycetota bacterium]
MKRSKLFMMVASLMAVTVLAAACGGEDEPAAPGDDNAGPDKIPVTLYFQGALSGPYSYLITPSFQGAQIKVDELNADDSFPAEITLLEADSQGDPEKAPPVVQEAVGDPNTVGIIGPGFSGESEASGDTYNENQIPFVSASATATSLGEKGWDFWYRAVGNDAGQGGFAGQFIAETLKPASVYVAHDKSDYGQPLAEEVLKVAGEGGVEEAGFQGVEAGADDYSALVSDLEASGAEAMFFGGYDADFGKIVKQARDEGVEIPLMSGDGSLSSTFLELAGDGADNVNLIAPTNISGDFIETYNSEVGGDASSVPVYAAEGYDVAGLFGEGIKAAIDGGAEDATAIRAGIKEYLDSLVPGSEYQGAAKPYAFDDVHELAADDIAELFFIYEVQGGELTSLGSAAELFGS